MLYFVLQIMSDAEYSCVGLTGHRLLSQFCSAFPDMPFPPWLFRHGGKGSILLEQKTA
jgi:hypothetical protein